MSESQSNDETGAAIERVSNRYWSLSESGSIESEGFAQVAVGLTTLLEDFQAAGMDSAQVALLVDGLDALADLLEDADAEDAPTVEAGLQQFVQRFCLDAEKRLAGLSISMMGIFNETADNDAAIDLSTQHLHAIRGGAAMLGLSDIADLSGAMEDLVLALKRQESSPSSWPVKSMLRSFAVLKSAVETPGEDLSTLVDDLVQDLRREIANLGKESAGDFERVDTSVQTRALEQRILVVDDVETIAASVGFILSELDIPVDVAHDGADALSKIRERAYSLVISDVAMPNMNGLELVREMRKDDILCDVPVILLTQLDTPEEKQRGLKAGANDYIVKGSIGGGDLVKRVENLLSNAPYVPALKDDTLRRNILVAEDTETIAASIAFVLSEGPYDIVLAHDGQDAFHKLNRRDYDLVITDVEMPSMDGFELLESIRNDRRLESIPVILLTARGSAPYKQRAEDLGANRFLVKGEVPAEELLRVVGEVFEES